MGEQNHEPGRILRIDQGLHERRMGTIWNANHNEAVMHVSRFIIQQMKAMKFQACHDFLHAAFAVVIA